MRMWRCREPRFVSAPAVVARRRQNLRNISDQKCFRKSLQKVLYQPRRHMVIVLRRRMTGRSWLSAKYIPPEIRPVLGAKIGGEIEPELEGPLQHAEAHGIQPVRIPLIRKKGGAVCTA